MLFHILDIVFTSGGTESNNMVLQTCLKYYSQAHPTHVVEKTKPHIITTNIEHDSILKVLHHYHAEGLAGWSVLLNPSIPIGSQL